MFRPSKLATTILIPAALLSATTGLAACGSGVDQSKINDVKQKAKDVQAKSLQVQKDIKNIQAQVQSGKLSAAAGQKKIETETASLETQAKGVASESIDAVKNNSHLSSDAKKQLEQAQQQLNASH